MLRTLLICGLLAGVCGGLLATGFAEIAGEPAVDNAISFEAQQAKAAGEAPKPVLVSRDVQKSVGLLTAAVVYGLALGGIFALVFAYAYGRVAHVSPAKTALWMAGFAFLILYLVPFIKYPANPPSVGKEDTIDRRTALYLLMMWSSVLAAVAAVRVRRQLVGRFGSSSASAAGVALYLVVVVAAGLALPGVHEVPATFPATTLWRFRESSVGMQLILWSTIGVVFSFTAQRVMTGKPVLALARR